MNIVARVFCLLASAAVVGATQTTAFAQSLILNDAFNGTNFNTNIWSVITPYCDSLIYETNGYAVFVNGGQLLTKSLMPSNMIVEGSFALTGSSYDQFSIWLRTDGSKLSGPNQTFYTGIQADFQVRSGDQGQTGVSNIKLVDNTSSTMVTASFSLAMNTNYPFKIIDSGTNILLYLNDLNNPLLTMNTTNRVGFKIGLENRMGACGGSSISAGSVTQLDYFQVYNNNLSIYTAIELDFVALAGQTYQIQSSTNLINWINVGSPITGSNQAVQQLYSTRGTNAQFYQLQNVTP